jgi:sugar phosphate permease
MVSPTAYLLYFPTFLKLLFKSVLGNYVGYFRIFSVQTEAKTESLDLHRWVVFGVICSIYILVYFHRVSTSVIATDLLAAFQTNAAALGFMSSMYFYFYAVEQPLVGYLSDRLGPRRVVVLWSLIAALGCMVFGLAPSIGWATMGRALIGFGVGGVYVPALKTISQWFSRKDLGTMTGMLIAFGNLGAIVATTPLAWMASIWGWRSSFFVIGGLTVVLALVGLFFVKDYVDKEAPSSKIASSEKPFKASALHIVTSSWFWVVAALFFGVFGGAVSLQGLWATPFLMSLFNLDRDHASLINVALPIGWMLGAPFFGRLGDRVFRDRVHLLTILFTLLTCAWFSLTFLPRLLGLGGVTALYAIVGLLAGGIGATLWATAQAKTPPAVMGIMSGLMNPFPLLGMALMQGVSGAIVNRAGKVGDVYSPEGYRNAFFVFLLIAAACFVLCVLFRKHLSTKKHGA